MLKEFSSNINVHYFYEKSLDELFNKMREAVDAEPNLGEITGVSIETELDYGDSVSVVLNIRHKRQETDKEIRDREKEEARIRKWKEEQFKALKKELGKDV